MTTPRTTLARWGAADIEQWTVEIPAPGDDPHARAVLVSPAVAPRTPCSEIIPSWGARTPPETWVEIQLRARSGARWTRAYRIAAWDAAPEHSRRASFAAQRDDDGFTATDTLSLTAPATAVQARVLLCAAGAAALPALTSLALCMSGQSQELSAERQSGRPLALDSQLSALELPLFSQYAYEQGAGWCSPTCLAMVLGYWHARTGDPRLAPFTSPASVPAHTAPGVYDPVYDGTGNWPFNTAFAAALGLEAFVTRMASLSQVARWVAAGVPVIYSLSWQPGDLDGAPIPRSAGHLIVITGFAGDCVHTADPAGASGGQVSRSYRADQLAACSRGAVYLIYPPGWPAPAPAPDDPW